MATILAQVPITTKKANEFIKLHHRHHEPTIRNGGKWAIAAQDLNDQLVGVAIAANPVSASYMDGYTIEITRLCSLPMAPKGTPSFLLSTCARIWKTMGGRRIITYTLEHESGASLRGAGWELSGTVAPHKRWTNKVRLDGIERRDLEIYKIPKVRWVRHLA